MNVRFLLDEHMPKATIAAVHRLEPAIDIVRVGGEGAPPLGIKDPPLLLWCEQEQRLLVTNNRKSMPGHSADHLAAGHHHWGVFRTHDDEPAIGPLAAAIHLIWGASDADEHRDTLDWMPT